MRRVRFGLVLNYKEWEAIGRLAKAEDTSRASLIRRYIYETAKTNGLWPAPEVRTEAQK